MAVRSDFVGKPGNAERGMAKNARGEPGFLDFGVAVHDAADPTQIDIHRTDRTTAHRNTGSGAVIRNSVDDLALILEARVNDLDRRDHVLGRPQNVSKTDARTLQRLAHDESELHLDPWLAVMRMFDLGAIGNELV